MVGQKAQADEISQHVPLAEYKRILQCDGGAILRARGLNRPIIRRLIAPDVR